MVVILGTPTEDSTRLYAQTVTGGDPTWAGPLAGEALGLPVYHIIESDLKDEIDGSVYEAEVGVAEMALVEAEEILEAIKEVREHSGVG